jgi:hypothetical protein
MSGPYSGIIGCNCEKPNILSKSCNGKNHGAAHNVDPLTILPIHHEPYSICACMRINAVMQ